MAQITAALVKELRERTSSGMMECKKALQETDGDIDAAVAHLRKSGQAKAEKKAGRTAAEGLVSIKLAPDGRKVAMVEVNSETDFVAKNDAFVQFVGAVAETVLTHEPADLSALAALPLDRGKSVEEVRMGLIAEIGENINVRRFSLVTTGAGVIAHYLHGSRIGVMVELDGGDAELAKDIAMHVAASNPVCISSADVPADLLAKERAIYSAQAADSGKPPEIVAKMVDGRISKYLKEVTLAGQPFVKDPDQTVEKLLTAKAARVVRFERYELGEGIEKKQENFAEEVIAQARGD